MPVAALTTRWCWRDPLAGRSAISSDCRLDARYVWHRGSRSSDLGLRDATDPVIFQAAKQAGAVVATKDADFAELVERLGAPPQVIWITCGNTSNVRLKEILTAGFPAAKLLLEQGEPLVEIADSQ